MVPSKFIFQSKKVPSYLKGLVETRARADGQAQRLERVMAELQEELQRARVERDSCDALLARFNAALAETPVKAVEAWKGRYGTRGDLRDEQVRYIREVYPESVTSNEVGAHLIAVFNLEFLTKKDEYNWRRSRVLNCMHVLRERGLVRQVDDPDRRHQEPARWIWACDTDSLESLAAKAHALGVRVDETADEDEGEGP